ncbi:MAG: DUF4331 family protein [Nannocystaceae bacterium]
MTTKRPWITALGAAALVAGAVQLQPQEVTAADHIDAPLSSADAAADIADFYAWPTGNGTIVAIITFAAGQEPFDPATPPTPWDSDVLYTIHIDNTGTAAEATQYLDNDNDNESDIQIQVRFAPSPTPGFEDTWAVEFLDVPGSSGPMVDFIEGAITDGSATAWAGLADDPFFFDFDGFLATSANLVDPADPVDLEFTSVNALGGMGLMPTGMVNDTFAGSNVAAIVVEFDAEMALDGNADSFLQMWATTGRL